MNWAAIGAVSEVVAAVAVVVSLVYLATQIRQANKTARATTRNAIAESAQALSQDVINNADKLDAVEMLRMQGRCYRDMRHWENIYYQVREGLLTAEEWSGFRKNLAALFEIEAYRDYWDSEADLYSAAFREQIDVIFQETSATQAGVKFAERFKNSS